MGQFTRLLATRAKFFFVASLLTVSVLPVARINAQDSDHRILYTNNQGAVHVVSIYPDGSGRVDYGPGQYPVFSPDESKIAFLKMDGPDLRVVVVDADGTNEISLTSNLPYTQIGGEISWSPDGTKIAFAQREPQQPADIMVANVDGSGEYNLTNTPNEYEERPQYSPNGAKIAYRDGSNGKLFVINSDGTNRVGASSVYVTSSSWSPNSQKLVFQGGFSGGNGVAIVNANGTSEYYLDQGSMPMWSPDGTRIAYITNCNCGQGSGQGISTISPDGTNYFKILNPPVGGGYGEIGWSPDGSSIVFTRYNPSDGDPYNYHLFYVAAAGGTPQFVYADDSGVSYPTWGVPSVTIPNEEQTTTFDASADAYVRSGQNDHNQGAETYMRLQSSGSNRGLVRFDQSAIQAEIGTGTVISAKLRLTITDNGNNWGNTGRTVDVHRLLKDWAEGNGTDSSRGTGSGATWNCAIDSAIQNQATDCTGATAWEMGQPNNPGVHPWYATASGTTNITNNQAGVVEFDVTADVASFVSGSSDNYGWLIKKTAEGQNGQVSFGTKEGSAVAQLVVTYLP
jgi:Tol biopolymer transport system component